jgi:hypothetical protein
VWGAADSGGPVFTLSSDPNRVLAVGIIVAGDSGQTTWCQGDQGRTCYRVGWYVRIQNVLSYWGATLRTG